MKAFFAVLSLVSTFSAMAHAGDLTCKGAVGGEESVLQFSQSSAGAGQAFLLPQGVSFKCVAADAGTNKLWECEQFSPGMSFLRLTIERTPHGDWASVNRVLVGGSTNTIATLDCRY